MYLSLFLGLELSFAILIHISFFRKIPAGDILIHAGDFTRCGNLKEVREFNTWIGTLPHKYKVVIAGNHELSFDQDFRNKMASTQNDCGDFGATASADQINASTPFSPRMVYCGRGGNDAHSAFSVSRSGSSTKILGNN